MTLITIATVATVTQEGTLTASVPRDIPPGEHRVILVLEQPLSHEDASSARVVPTEVSEMPDRRPVNLPVIHVKEWPENLSLRREDLYDEWGR